MNLSGGMKKRSRRSWAGLPIGAKSTEEPLGERAGPERGPCVGRWAWQSVLTDKRDSGKPEGNGAGLNR